MRRRRREVVEGARTIVGTRTRRRRFTNTMADIESAGEKKTGVTDHDTPRHTVEGHDDGCMVCSCSYKESHDT